VVYAGSPYFGIRARALIFKFFPIMMIVLTMVDIVFLAAELAPFGKLKQVLAYEKRYQPWSGISAIFSHREKFKNQSRNAYRISTTLR